MYGLENIKCNCNLRLLKDSTNLNSPQIRTRKYNNILRDSMHVLLEKLRTFVILQCARTSTDEVVCWSLIMTNEHGNPDPSWPASNTWCNLYEGKHHWVKGLQIGSSWLFIWHYWWKFLIKIKFWLLLMSALPTPGLLKMIRFTIENDCFETFTTYLRNTIGLTSKRSLNVHFTWETADNTISFQFILISISLAHDLIFWVKT